MAVQVTSAVLSVMEWLAVEWVCITVLEDVAEEEEEDIDIIEGGGVHLLEADVKSQCN